MNNQLRKIVGQAVSAVDIVTGNEALDDELAKMYIPDCFAEKFAELILKECLKYIDDSFGDIDYVKFMIKRNFGVEE